jgi:hypothetical protein
MKRQAVRPCLWFLSFLAEAVRSAPQRSRARRFSGAAKRTLEGEERCESIARGGKGLVLKGAMPDFSSVEGQP